MWNIDKCLIKRRTTKAACYVNSKNWRSVWLNFLSNYLYSLKTCGGEKILYWFIYFHWEFDSKANLRNVFFKRRLRLQYARLFGFDPSKIFKNLDFSAICTEDRPTIYLISRLPILKLTHIWFLCVLLEIKHTYLIYLLSTEDSIGLYIWFLCYLLKITCIWFIYYLLKIAHISFPYYLLKMTHIWFICYLYWSENNIYLTYLLSSKDNIYLISPFIEISYSYLISLLDGIYFICSTYV